MNKKKSIICTALFVFALVVILIGSSFIENKETGLNLYRLIIHISAYSWFADRVGKFYDWLYRGY